MEIKNSLSAILVMRKKNQDFTFKKSNKYNKVCT